MLQLLNSCNACAPVAPACGAHRCTLLPIRYGKNPPKFCYMKTAFVQSTWEQFLIRLIHDITSELLYQMWKKLANLPEKKPRKKLGSLVRFHVNSINTTNCEQHFNLKRAKQGIIMSPWLQAAWFWPKVWCMWCLHLPPLFSYGLLCYCYVAVCPIPQVLVT